MKNIQLPLIMIVSVVIVHLSACWGFAATPAWRAQYDVIMAWINFGILVGIIYKFGKKPLADFLDDRKQDLAQIIKQLEDEKVQIASKIEDTLEILNQGEVYFEKMKTRIITEGERRRDAIIEDARQESEQILKSSRHQIKNRIMQAKNQFKAELIDTAIEMTKEHLPKEITPDDNQNLINNYLYVADIRLKPNG